MSYIDSYYRRKMHPATAAQTPSDDALQGDLDTSVCIIGGGLAGISTALGLAERGIPCVLLEAKRLGWGASGRNGGFVSCGFSQNALTLAKQLGEPHAQQLYGLTRQAYKLIEQRISGHEAHIKDPVEGNITASWFDNAAGLRHYVDEMNRIFGEDLVFWPREKIRESYRTQRYFDGYFKPRALRFQSLNYALHTAAMARNLGASLFEDSRVTQVNAISGATQRWQVKTAQGTVRARHVVYACSGYLDSLHGKLSRATLPVATYVLLTEPLGARLETAIRSPYGVADNRFSSNYYRVVGDQQLLWGGRVSMFHPSQEKLRTIMRNDLLSVYPQLEGIQGEVAWGGYMGYSAHKMPQLGQLKPGEWFCQSFGGHGMVTTTMGGELIAAAIATDDPQYLLFADFGLDYVGKPFGPVIAQIAYWAYQLQDAFHARRLNH
jgi:gamma-glutamylputrescine oxidase